MFMEFDEEKFYPSISRELLQKAINWTWTFVRISNGEINVIMHSWKSLLFDGDNIWIKKHDDPNFKITMASYDATEICELVGLYILHVLREKHGKEKKWLLLTVWHIFWNIIGSQAERIRKEFISIFKTEFKLSIICEKNLKICRCNMKFEYRNSQILQ